MNLCDFFIVKPITGQKKSVAIRLKNIESGSYGNERCSPDIERNDDGTATYNSRFEIYPVRAFDDGVYVKFPREYRKLKEWKGEPIHINTAD